MMVFDRHLKHRSNVKDFFPLLVHCIGKMFFRDIYILSFRLLFPVSLCFPLRVPVCHVLSHALCRFSQRSVGQDRNTSEKQADSGNDSSQSASCRLWGPVALFTSACAAVVHYRKLPLDRCPPGINVSWCFIAGQCRAETREAVCACVCYSGRRRGVNKEVQYI